MVLGATLHWHVTVTWQSLIVSWVLCIFYYVFMFMYMYVLRLSEASYTIINSLTVQPKWKQFGDHYSGFLQHQIFAPCVCYCFFVFGHTGTYSPIFPLIKHETSIKSHFQNHLRFIDFTSERDVYVHFLCIRSFYESHVGTTHIWEMIVRSNLGWFLHNIL